MADGELTQGRAKWSRGRGASEETQRQAEEGASRERWGGAGKSWGWGEGWQSGESEGALGGIWREEGEEGEERETTRNLGTSHCGIDLLRELHGDSDAGVGLDRDMGLLDARAPGLGGAGRGRGGGWMRRTAVDEAEVEEAEEAVIFRGLP